MPNIDPVILKLEADLADYRRGVDQAQRLSDRRFGEIETRAGRMSSAVSKGFNLAKTAALAFVAAHGIGAIKDLITEGLEYAASLGETATQLGVTSDALQEYYYLASQVGVSNEEMEKGLVMLNRRIGLAAAGNKEAANAFEQLGVEIRDANGNVRNAADLIPELADGLSQLGSDAERVAASTLLFSRAGAQLLPALKGGADEVNRLRQAAHELGLVLSEEQIRKADETADKLSALKQVLAARIAGVVSDNTDSIIDLVDALSSLVVAVGDAIGWWKNFTNTLAGFKIPASLTNLVALLGPLGFLVDGTRRGLGALGGGGGAPSSTGPWYGKGQPTNGWYGSGGQGSGAGTRTFSLAGSGSGAGAGGGGGSSGPSAADIRRAMDEAAIEAQRLAADLAMTRAELTGNLQDRAAAEKQRIDADLAADLARIAQTENITAELRAQQSTLQEQTAAARRELVDQQLAEDIKEKLADQLRDQQTAAREAEERRATMAGFEIDAVDAEAAFAETRNQRLDLERRLLALQQEEERARLEAAIAAGDIADAAKARAALDRRQAAETRGLERDQEGPGKRYLRGLRDEAANLSEAYESIAVDGLQRVEDSLAQATKNALGLHGVLGDIVGDLIQIAIRQVLMGRLADAIFGGASLFGGGGLQKGTGMGGTGALKVRASGGRGEAGQMYRVNEGASPGRVEGFMPLGEGKIIPLGQMNALRPAARNDGVATVRVELSGDIDARIERVSGPVAVQVVRASAPAMIDAAANETGRRFSRPRL